MFDIQTIPHVFTFRTIYLLTIKKTSGQNTRKKYFIFTTHIIIIINILKNVEEIC